MQTEEPIHEPCPGTSHNPCAPLRLHLSLMLPAPPPLCFQKYFQHGKFYLKGIFPLSFFFFFLLDEKPKGCKMQSFPPSRMRGNDADKKFNLPHHSSNRLQFLEMDRKAGVDEVDLGLRA